MNDRFNLVNGTAYSPATNTMQSINNAKNYSIVSSNATELDFFSNKKYEKQAQMTTKKYNDILDMYRTMYQSEKNPEDVVLREQMASILHNIYPEYSKDWFYKNTEAFMKQATGVDTDIKSYGDHLLNSWRSTCANINTSLGIYGTLAKYAGNYDSASYHKDMERVLAWADKSGADYRKDIGDEKYDSLIARMFAGSVEQTPHSVLGMGLSALEAVTSFVSAPISLVVKGVRLTSEFVVSGLSEAGALARDMLREGFDPSTVLNTATVVGIMIGAIETGASEWLFAKPIQAFSKAGGKAASDAFVAGVKGALKEIPKEVLTSFFTEPAQEVTEEFIGWLAKRIATAYEVQNGRMKDPETGEFWEDFTTDFVKSAVDVAKATALSTPFMTLGSGILGVGIGYASKGGLSVSGNAVKYMNYSKDSKVVPTSAVVFDNGSKTSVTKEQLKSRKANQLEGVWVGDKFIVKNGDEYQKAAVKEQKYAVYKSSDSSVESVSKERKINFDGYENMKTENGEPSRERFVRSMQNMFASGDLQGFTFLSENKKPVEDYSKASYVALITKRSDSVALVEFGTDNSISSLEKDLYGKTSMADMKKTSTTPTVKMEYDEKLENDEAREARKNIKPEDVKGLKNKRTRHSSTIDKLVDGNVLFDKDGNEICTVRLFEDSNHIELTGTDGSKHLILSDVFADNVAAEYIRNAVTAKSEDGETVNLKPVKSVAEQVSEETKKEDAVEDAIEKISSVEEPEGSQDKEIPESDDGDNGARLDGEEIAPSTDDEGTEGNSEDGSGEKVEEQGPDTSSTEERTEEEGNKESDNHTEEETETEEGISESSEEDTDVLTETSFEDALDKRISESKVASIKTMSTKEARRAMKLVNAFAEKFSDKKMPFVENDTIFSYSVDLAHMLSNLKYATLTAISGDAIRVYIASKGTENIGFNTADLAPSLVSSYIMSNILPESESLSEAVKVIGEDLNTMIQTVIDADIQEGGPLDEATRYAFGVALGDITEEDAEKTKTRREALALVSGDVTKLRRALNPKQSMDKVDKLSAVNAALKADLKFIYDKYGVTRDQLQKIAKKLRKQISEENIEYSKRVIKDREYKISSNFSQNEIESGSFSSDNRRDQYLKLKNDLDEANARIAFYTKQLEDLSVDLGKFVFSTKETEVSSAEENVVEQPVVETPNTETEENTKENIETTVEQSVEEITSEKDKTQEEILKSKVDFFVNRNSRVIERVSNILEKTNMTSKQMRRGFAKKRTQDIFHKAAYGARANKSLFRGIKYTGFIDAIYVENALDELCSSLESGDKVAIMDSFSRLIGAVYASSWSNDNSALNAIASFATSVGYRDSWKKIRTFSDLLGSDEAWHKYVGDDEARISDSKVVKEAISIVAGFYASESNKDIVSQIMQKSETIIDEFVGDKQATVERPYVKTESGWVFDVDSLAENIRQASNKKFSEEVSRLNASIVSLLPQSVQEALIFRLAASGGNVEVNGSSLFVFKHKSSRWKWGGMAYNTGEIELAQNNMYANTFQHELFHQLTVNNPVLRGKVYSKLKEVALETPEFIDFLYKHNKNTEFYGYKNAQQIIDILKGYDESTHLEHEYITYQNINEVAARMFTIWEDNFNMSNFYDFDNAPTVIKELKKLLDSLVNALRGAFGYAVKGDFRNPIAFDEAFGYLFTTDYKPIGVEGVMGNSISTGDLETELKSGYPQYNIPMAGKAIASIARENELLAKKAVNAEKYNPLVVKQREKVATDYIDRLFRNPGGALSNLPAEDWITVRTEAFKNWAGGDWEGIKSKSYVILEDNTFGEPLVLYHGSPETNIEAFKNTGTHPNNGNWMFHFSPFKSVAEHYAGDGGKIYRVYAKSKHMFDFENLREEDLNNLRKAMDGMDQSIKDEAEDKLQAVSRWYTGEEERASSCAWLMSNVPDFFNAIDEYGYDAIRYFQHIDLGEGSYSLGYSYAFTSPNQVKATDNNGFFATDDMRIRYQTDSGRERYSRDEVTAYNANDVFEDMFAPEYSKAGKRFFDMGEDEQFYESVDNAMEKIREFTSHMKAEYAREYMNLATKYLSNDMEGKSYRYDSNDGVKMLAPNGKDSNLPMTLWLVTRMDSFKNWFGDWESNPETASKVVDENGEPKMVYHTTSAEAAKVLEKAPMKIGGGSYYGAMLYFADHKGARGSSGNSAIKAFLNIRNMAEIGTDKGNTASGTLIEIQRKNGLYDIPYSEFSDKAKELNSQFKEQTGIDGFSVPYKGWYAVLDSTQVKSATMNNGAFNPDDGRLRYQAENDSRSYFSPMDIAYKPSGISPYPFSESIDANGEKKYTFNKKELAKSIRAGSNGRIGLIASNLCASVMSRMNKNVQDAIIRKNLESGRGFIINEAELSESDWAMYGIKKGSFKGVSLLDSARIVLSDKSDVTTILHEAFHLAFNFDENTKARINDAVLSAGASEASKAELGSLIKSNWRIFSDIFSNTEEALDALMDTNDIVRNEEALARLYEAWYMNLDKFDRDNKSTLDKLFDVFRSIADFFRSFGVMQNDGYSARYTELKELDDAMASIYEDAGVASPSLLSDELVRAQKVNEVLGNDSPLVIRAEKTKQIVFDSVIDEADSFIKEFSRAYGSKPSSENISAFVSFLETKGVFESLKNIASDIEVDSIKRSVATRIASMSDSYNSWAIRIGEALKKFHEDEVAGRTLIDGIFSEIVGRVKTASSKHGMYKWGGKNNGRSGEMYAIFEKSLKASAEVAGVSFSEDELNEISSYLHGATTDMSNDTAEKFIGALITENAQGMPIVACDVVDGRAYGGLITLLNFANTDTSAKAIKSDKNSANIDYYVMAQTILMSTQGLNEKFDEMNGVDGILFSLVDAMQHDKTGLVSELYNKYMTGKTSEEIVKWIEEEVSKAKKNGFDSAENAKAVEDSIRVLQAQAETLEDLMAQLNADVVDREEVISKLLEQEANLREKIFSTINFAESKWPGYFSWMDGIREKLPTMSNVQALKVVQRMVGALGNLSSTMRKSMTLEQLMQTKTYKDMVKVARAFDKVATGLQAENSVVAGQFEKLNEYIGKNSTHVGEYVAFDDIYGEFGYVVGDKEFEPLWNELWSAGLITLEDDGFIVNKTFNEANADDLLKITRKAAGIDKIAKKQWTYQNKVRKERNERIREAIREGLINKLNMSPDKAENYLRRWTERQRAGSHSAEKRKTFKSMIEGLQYEIMSREIKRRSPETFALLFGGTINGEYVSDNFNALENSMTERVTARIEGLYSEIDDAFGLGLYKKDNNKFMDWIAKNFSRELHTIPVPEYNSELYSNTIEAFLVEHDLGQIINGRFMANSNIGSEYSAFVNKYVELIDKLNSLNDELESLYRSPLATKERILQKQTEIHDLERMLDGSNYDEENGSNYSMQQLLGIWSLAHQEDSMNKLISQGWGRINNNHSLAEIVSVFKMFESPDMDAYRRVGEYIINDSQAQYKKVADIHYKLTGKILKRYDNYLMYVPVDKNGLATRHVTVDMFDTDSDAFTPDGSLKAQKDYFYASVDERITKKRTESASTVDTNILDNFIYTVRSQEKYIAMKEKIENLRDIFSASGRLANDFMIGASNLGENASEKELYKGLDSQGRFMENFYTYIEAVAGNIDKDDQGDFGSIMARLRSNLSAARLVGNVPSLLSNYSLLFVSSVRNGFKNTIEAFGNKATTEALAYRLAPQLIDRNRIDVYDFRRTRDEAMTEIESKLNSFLPGDDATFSMKHAYRRFLGWSFDAMQKIDSQIANAYFVTTYNRLFNEMRENPEYADLYSRHENKADEGLSQFEKMVSEIALQETLDLVQSQNAKDNALMYTNRDTMMKQLLMYTSQSNKLFNVVVQGLRDSKAGDMEAKEFIADIIGIALVAAFTSAIRGRGWADKDEPTSERLLKFLMGTMSEVVGTIPLANDIASVINGESGYGDATLNSVAKLANAITDIDNKNRSQKMVTATKALGRNLVETFATYGVPSPVLATKNAYRVFKGEDGIRFNPFYLYNKTIGEFFER